ncbi:MAG: DUF1080 domain-containing protein [Pirellulaceae bacterium]|nr:DUF1080 domain-containing protein [Pirellulaceae bacterium]
MHRFLLIVGVTLSQVAILPIADGQEATVVEEGYQPIFDGRTLAGWEGAGEPAEKCWKVDDGQIVCTGEKGPWLRSQEQYGDYNLRFRYRLKAGGNSGVYIRVPTDGNHHGAGAGIEVQLLDDAAERYRTLKPYQYTGSLYAIAPAREHVGRRITARKCGSAICELGRLSNCRPPRRYRFRRPSRSSRCSNNAF